MGKQSNLSDKEVVAVRSDPEGQIKQALVTVCRAYGFHGEGLERVIGKAAAILLNPELDEEGRSLLTRLVTIHRCLYETDYNYDKAMELLEKAQGFVTEDPRFKQH
jgi:hypothetical protein